MNFSINVGTRDAWLDLRQQLVNQQWPLDQTEGLFQVSDPDQNKLNFVYFDET